MERRAQAPLIVVLDLDQAEESAISLLGGAAMRVRVIPVERGAVAHPEIVGVALARCRQRHAAAVVPRVDSQAVPVHDGRLVELVDKLDPDPLTGLENQRRIAIFATLVGREISQRQGGSAALAARRNRRRAQRNDLAVAGREAPEPAVAGGHEQRSGTGVRRTIISAGTSRRQRFGVRGPHAARHRRACQRSEYLQNIPSSHVH